MRGGASRDPLFDCGLCPLSLGNLKTGRRYYINRAQTKRKETAPEKTILISTVGSGWACVYPGLDVGRQEGAGLEPFVSREERKGYLRSSD